MLKHHTPFDMRYCTWGYLEPASNTYTLRDRHQHREQLWLVLPQLGFALAPT